MLATTSTIRLPYVLPSRTIVTVEIVFRSSFCAVPAFILVEPAITSGPTTTATSCSASRPSSESSAQTSATVSAPVRRAALGGADHVGRATARREQDDGIALLHVRGLDVARSRDLVVLGRLLGDRERGDAAGHEDDHLLGRDAERRPALGGIDRREPSGGAGADVDQPAAALEPLGDRIDRGRERAGGAAHGCRHARVLLVDQLDEVERRAQIEVGAAGDVVLGDGLAVSHGAGV